MTESRRLTLVLHTPADVRAMIGGMDAAQRAELSPDWLARVETTTEADPWTLGFALVHRTTGVTVGTCGFKGPAGSDGVVEIAYGIEPDHQGKGYATEVAGALVAYAVGRGSVRLVRAHTLPQVSASTRVLEKSGFERVGDVIDPEDGVVWRWERAIDVDGTPSAPGQGSAV